jgi:hypothetical protein
VSLINYAQFKEGDGIACWGPWYNPVSEAIQLWTGLGPSHFAVVRQARHQNYPQGPTIIESTLDSRGNGVRTSTLDELLTGYPHGSRVERLPLKACIHKQIDWQAFYRLCGWADDHVRYDVAGLFAFAFPPLRRFGIGTGREHEVCSVFSAALYEYSGATRGVLPYEQNPARVKAYPIFDAPVRIL